MDRGRRLEPCQCLDGFRQSPWRYEIQETGADQAFARHSQKAAEAVIDIYEPTAAVDDQYAVLSGLEECPVALFRGAQQIRPLLPVDWIPRGGWFGHFLHH